MSAMQTLKTTLEYSSDGTSYNSIGPVANIAVDGVTVESIEDNDLDNTAKVFLPSKLTDGGTVNFDGNYDPDSTGHQQVQTLMNTPENYYWKVTYNNDGTNGKEHTFQGHLNNFGINSSYGANLITYSASIKVSGSHTFPS